MEIEGGSSIDRDSEVFGPTGGFGTSRSVKFSRSQVRRLIDVRTFY
jgi:hypothetical protein